MPDATITSTASTFGTISGTFAADQSTVTGTVTAIIPGTLSGSVGVPGPQGPAGSQGPQGEPGPAGVGVPVGGTTGQVLAKTSNTDYATGWTTLTLTQYLEKANNLSDLTNVTTARTNLALGATDSVTFGTLATTVSGTAPVSNRNASVDNTDGFKFSYGTIGDAQPGIVNTANQLGFKQTRTQTFSGNTNIVTAGLQATASIDQGLVLLNQNYNSLNVLTSQDKLSASLFDGRIRFVRGDNAGYSLSVSGLYFISPGGVSALGFNENSITFPDATVQTTAFTGFNDVVLTGNPTAPTPELTDDSTSLATTAFVKGQGYLTSVPAGYATEYWVTSQGYITSAALAGYATESWVASQGYLTSAPVTSVAGKTGDVILDVADISGAAPLESPVFTGDAQAVTAALGDNDTSIATTAFVQQELLSGTANAKNLEVYVRNQTGSTLAAGTIVYVNGATGNRPTVTPAQANNDANSAQTIGFVKTSIANNGFGYVIVRGELENINTSALTEGVQLYLSPTTAGTWTTTKPSAPQHLVYVGIVIRSHPTLGAILVSVQNGYELNELHDVALASEANNDLLVYESSTDLWKNKSFSTLGLATQSYVTSQGYITSSALTGYATESWVTSQGYLTSAPVTSVAGKTGAVTLAVADVSGAAPLASPTFTGTPSLPTGTTAVTQAAGNNTTAVATTAFVQQEVPAVATTAQALDLTSNSVTVSPLALSKALMHPGFRKYTSFAGNAVGTTSGTGSSNYAHSHWIENVGPTSGTTGHAMMTPANVTGYDMIGRDGSTNINFSKRILFSGKFGLAASSGFNGDASNYWLCTLGKSSVYAGNLTGRGIGIRKYGATANFFLVVHNGTTLTAIDSGVSNNNYSTNTDFLIYSDGAGNVTMWLNDVQVATTALGPTGTATNGARIYSEVNQVGTFGARIGAHVSNLALFISP